MTSRKNKNQRDFDLLWQENTFRAIIKLAALQVSFPTSPKLQGWTQDKAPQHYKRADESSAAKVINTTKFWAVFLNYLVIKTLTNWQAKQVTQEPGETVRDFYQTQCFKSNTWADRLCAS